MFGNVPADCMRKNGSLKEPFFYKTSGPFFSLSPWERVVSQAEGLFQALWGLSPLVKASHGGRGRKPGEQGNEQCYNASGSDGAWHLCQAPVSMTLDADQNNVHQA